MDNEQKEQISVSSPLNESSKGQVATPQGLAPKTESQGGIPATTGKSGRPKGKLGRRTQLFMELVLMGHTTQEAYHLAGYKGQKNAAYVLRSQLKDRIEERLLSDGISREGAKLALQELMKLPLDPTIKERGITIKEKIMILKFLDKLTEKEEGRMPQITPFLVQVNDPKSVTIQEGK